jgi:RimJ/RimL family protein N-acetyltransferase/ribosomal protein S18 acetylase RimI-like enzyme
VERHEPPALILTPRLRGEAVAPGHQDAFEGLFGDPQVGATLGGVMTAEKVASIITSDAADWERDGYGPWAWFEREGGGFVGRGGLHHTHVGGRDEVEVAWAVTPACWGRGYATELGAASLDVGFGPAGLRDVVAFTLPSNVPSWRVMEKLGFAFEREVEHAGEPHVLYRCTRAVARIRQGEAGDAPLVLAMFDEAVEWVVARGQTGQWGTEPFSSKPQNVERAQAWASGGGLRVAEDEDGAALGVIVLGERYPHVEPVDEPERYVQLLLTSRDHAGRRVGATLVAAAAAEARAAGAALLRVDCWAGAPSLVAWYERQGFARSSTFEVDGWRGQVFTMRL